jgi:hypothetical protein
MKPVVLLLALAIAWLAGCSRSIGERVIYERGSWWSIRQVSEPHPAGGTRTYYRVYHEDKLVTFAPPLVRRETSKLLAVGHFNPGVFPYPDLIVLVYDQFTDPRGYGNAQVRAFQLSRDSGRMEIVPIAIP